MRIHMATTGAACTCERRWNPRSEDDISDEREVTYREDAD